MSLKKPLKRKHLKREEAPRIVANKNASRFVQIAHNSMQLSVFFFKHTSWLLFAFIRACIQKTASFTQKHQPLYIIAYFAIQKLFSRRFFFVARYCCCCCCTIINLKTKCPNFTSSYNTIQKALSERLVCCNIAVESTNERSCTRAR